MCKLPQKRPPSFRRLPNELRDHFGMESFWLALIVLASEESLSALALHQPKAKKPLNPQPNVHNESR